MIAGEGVAQRAGRREWIGLAVIALPCALYSMDLTVLDLAVPRLSVALRPSSAQLLWIVDVYGFVLASLLIPMGALGDRIGRRRLLLIGAAAFGVASGCAAVAAFAGSAGGLIAARAALGVAGATIAPSTLSLIRNMFRDERQRTAAIGLWVTSYSVGGAIGPLVGGALLERFWWGSVFLVGVPAMALLLAVGPVLLPEFRDPQVRRLDFVSAAMSLATVLLVVYGIKRIAFAGSSRAAAAAIVVGAAVGALFVRRQRALADPLVDPRLFRDPAFAAALGAYGAATLVVFGGFLFLVQYLQLVKGLSPLAAGVATLPMFAGFVGGALAAPTLARRLRRETVLIAGLLSSALGFGVLATTDAESAVTVAVAAAAVYSLALSPVFALATDLVVGAAPPERAGVAAALSESASELGGALGIALLGTVGGAVYRRAMEHAIPPGTPAELAEAARNTLGGAAAAAGRLPDGAASAALSAGARAAFSAALHAVSLLSVAVVLAAALCVFLARRRRPAAAACAAGGPTPRRSASAAA